MHTHFNKLGVFVLCWGLTPKHWIRQFELHGFYLIFLIEASELSCAEALNTTKPVHGRKHHWPVALAQLKLLHFSANTTNCAHPSLCTVGLVEKREKNDHSFKTHFWGLWDLPRGCSTWGFTFTSKRCNTTTETSLGKNPATHFPQLSVNFKNSFVESFHTQSLESSNRQRSKNKQIYHPRANYNSPVTDSCSTELLEIIWLWLIRCFN